MKANEREYIGRASRGQNALASVAPIAQRLEDGTWELIDNERAQFPPEGVVEIRGVLATQIRDGDWIVFNCASNDRFKAINRIKAVSPRRLVRFLGGMVEGTSEDRRRLVVEAGLEDGTEGDFAIRFGGSAVVRISLAQSPDGRFRAQGGNLSALPVRRFNPDCLIEIPGSHDSPAYYDYEGSKQTGDIVNWSRDIDYVRSAVASVAGNKPEVVSSLAAVLDIWGKTSGGRLSSLGGADPSVLDEIARSGALAAHLQREGEAAEVFRTALRSDPSIEKAIAQEVSARSESQLPTLTAAVRSELTVELDATRASALRETSALVAELEAAEMASIELKRTERLAAVEAELKERLATVEAELETARQIGTQAVEFELAEIRSYKQAELVQLDQQRRERTSDVESLAARKAEIESTVDHLEEREKTLVTLVESLSQAGDRLSATTTRSAGVIHPAFLRFEHEALFELGEVRARAEALAILSEDGIKAILQLALYASAGEIPIVHGGDAVALVETAALILSGNRLAFLAGDPTIVTYEDLWSRAGGNGPTVLAVAAEAARSAGDPPIMAAMIGADRSAARFWFPSLVDAYRRGHLPTPLLICATVDDLESDESQVALGSGIAINAKGAFAEGASAVYATVLADTERVPTAFSRKPLTFDGAKAIECVMRFGKSLDMVGCRRLASIHAAARECLSEGETARFMAEVAAALSGNKPSPQSSDKPHLLIRNANA